MGKKKKELQSLKEDMCLLIDYYAKMAFKGKVVSESKEESVYVEDVRGGTDPETVYHKKYSGFTKKLQKIMQFYPSLPVVIPEGLRIGNGELDCSIGYVYHKGDFTEKVILIHGAKENFPVNVSDEYIEVPFR